MKKIDKEFETFSDLKEFLTKHSLIDWFFEKHKTKIEEFVEEVYVFDFKKIWLNPDWIFDIVSIVKTTELKVIEEAIEENKEMFKEYKFYDVFYNEYDYIELVMYCKTKDRNIGEKNEN